MEGVPRTSAARARRRRSRHNHITITHADGTQKVVKPGSLRLPAGTRREQYVRYMNSPEWRALRKKVLRRDEGACVDCSSGEALQIHHLTYARFGAEQLEDLVTLCDGCHEARHMNPRA
jgi:5-methylcytosine-specific restriction endonuclease McrA